MKEPISHAYPSFDLSSGIDLTHVNLVQDTN